MSVEVVLEKPIKGPRGAIEIVRFKEPTFDMLMNFGEPISRAFKDGVALVTEDPDTIRKYIENCADCDPNFLKLVSFRDAMAIKEVILNFFYKARQPAEPAPSDALAESSLSGSESTFVPSKI